MAPVPHPRGEGQAPTRTLDITNPRSVFVWISEAQEAMEDLATVAADAVRHPRRRKLSRRVARARYRRARAALAWLLSLPIGPSTAPQSATTGPFEAWAE
jgi:hypothetical protein